MRKTIITKNIPGIKRNPQPIINWNSVEPSTNILNQVITDPTDIPVGATLFLKSGPTFYPHTITKKTESTIHITPEVMDIGVRTLTVTKEPTPAITANSPPDAVAEIEAILTSETLCEYEGVIQKYHNIIKSSRNNEGAMIPRRNFNPQRIPRTTRRCAIIVPYQNNPELGTDRTEFLSRFRDHHTPISKLIETEAFRKQGVRLTIEIIVVEQSKNTVSGTINRVAHRPLPSDDDEGSIAFTHKFNRGALLNAGFKIAAKSPGLDYVVFHSADLLISKNPRDAAPYIEMVAQYPMEPAILRAPSGGEIVAISVDDFQSCGGFPNSYFGWGGETDALRRRLAGIGLGEDHIHIIDATKKTVENQEEQATRAQKKRATTGTIGDNILRKDLLAQEPNYRDGITMDTFFSILGNPSGNENQIVELAPNTYPDVNAVVRAEDYALADQFIGGVPDDDGIRNIYREIHPYIQFEEVQRIITETTRGEEKYRGELDFLDTVRHHGIENALKKNPPPLNRFHWEFIKSSLNRSTSLPHPLKEEDWVSKIHFTGEARPKFVLEIVNVRKIRRGDFVVYCGDTTLEMERGDLQKVRGVNVDAGTLLISHYRTGRRVACSAYLCGGVMVNRGSRVNMWWNSVDEGIPLDTQWDLVGGKWPTTLLGSSVKKGGLMALRWHPEIVGALGDEVELVKRAVEPRVGPFQFGYRGVVGEGGVAKVERVLLMREKVGGGRKTRQEWSLQVGDGLIEGGGLKSMKLMGKVAAPTMLPVGFGMKFQDYVFRESSLTLDENRIMGRLGHLCGELANVVTEMNLRNLMERLTLEEKELLVHVSGGVDLGEGTLSAFEGVRGEFLGGIVTKQLSSLFAFRQWFGGYRVVAEKSRLQETLKYLHEATCPRGTGGTRCIPLNGDEKRIIGQLMGRDDIGDLADADYVERLSGDSELLARMQKVIVEGRQRRAPRLMDGARQDLLTFREMAACEARGDGEVVQSNPEFKEFTHVVPVLGSVSQVNEEIVGRRRGKGAVKGKRRLIGGDGVWSRSLGDVALKAPMQRELNDASVWRTLEYMWDYARQGIYVKVRMNRVVSFWPFVNMNYANGLPIEDFWWVSREEFPGGLGIATKNAGAGEQFGVKEAVSGVPTGEISPVKKWMVNGCLVETLLDKRGMSDRGFQELRDMLISVCMERGVPDCEFFVNPREFPVLRKDGKDPRMIEGAPELPRKQGGGKWAPVVGASGGAGFMDIPIPRVEEWKMVTGLKQERSCGVSALEEPLLEPLPWSERTNRAVWRGEASGCGVTGATNQRLGLLMAARKLAEKNPRQADFLDVGVTAQNEGDDRMVDGKMKFLRPDVAGGDARDARFGLVGDMSNALRARARFAFVVDGYGAPKDLMRALGEGFCVLRVKSASGYRGWFEHALVEGTHQLAVETDYSNLEEVIKYCLKNTAKVREISEAGRRVYLEKLGRDGILDYLATMMTKMNGRVVPDVGSSWNLIDQGGVEPVVVEEVRVEKGKRGVVEEAVAKKRVVVAEEPPVRVPGAEIKVQQLKRPRWLRGAVPISPPKTNLGVRREQKSPRARKVQGGEAKRLAKLVMIGRDL